MANPEAVEQANTLANDPTFHFSWRMTGDQVEAASAVGGVPTFVAGMALWVTNNLPYGGVPANQTSNANPDGVINASTTQTSGIESPYPLAEVVGATAIDGGIGVGIALAIRYAVFRRRRSEAIRNGIDTLLSLTGIHTEVE
jgi:hypothetical protein